MSTAHNQAINKQTRLTHNRCHQHAHSQVRRGNAHLGWLLQRVTALAALRGGSGAELVRVLASSGDADDDDKAWFRFAGALNGFDPDAVEEVGGAFGTDGLVQGEQDGEAGIRVLVFGGLGDILT